MYGQDSTGARTTPSRAAERPACPRCAGPVSLPSLAAIMMSPSLCSRARLRAARGFFARLRAGQNQAPPWIDIGSLLLEKTPAPDKRACEAVEPGEQGGFRNIHS